MHSHGGMKLLKMIASKSKPLTPLMLGLCLGITLSLIVVPFQEGTCPSAADEKSTTGARGGSRLDLPSARKTKSVDSQGEDYENMDEYEPRIVQVEHSTGQPQSGSSQKKRLRPRYASTELGIREKLYVGVLTSRKSIEYLGVAINKTLAHYVTKLVFFMDARGPTLPGSMSIVSFSDERPSMRPFHMFKYIGDHYVKSFDWFYFITDETYVRGEKLFDMVTHLSITQNVYAGVPSTVDPLQPYCNFDGGILISQPVMAKIFENLDWCAKSLSSNSHTDNIGKCVLHSSNLGCMPTVQGFNYTAYLDDHLYLHKNPEAEWSTAHVQQLNSAVAVHKMDRPATVYKVHRYFCELEINRTRQDLEKTKETITKIAPSHPHGKGSLTWPIGVDPPSHPKNRFDILRWDYFTESQIYLDSDFSNMKTLTGIDLLDVRDVLNTSLHRLNKKYDNKLMYNRLVNGYRRFDPTRGMEYVIDLGLKEKGAEKEVIKRVKLVRPLGYVEIVPMPYVTENSRVNLVLPVTTKDKDGVVSFLDTYAKTCLDTGDNSNLYVVFIYEGSEPKTKKDDPYTVMKSMISYYENKYVGTARMTSITAVDVSPSEFTVADAISKKLPAESLILIATVGMELSIEFLNRVRMNTINGWQVFFPIGFWQYKPSLVYTEKPYPSTIEINKNVGHFDESSYVVAGFYNNDYLYARKKMQTARTVKKSVDLYEMFLKYHNLHVFRAVEPALRHDYRERVCNPILDEDSYSKCLKQRSEGLASRAQLAMLILEHQQNFDKGHMDVIKKQNNPNVVQMKPNMLKKRKK